MKPYIKISQFTQAQTIISHHKTSTKDGNKIIEACLENGVGFEVEFVTEEQFTAYLRNE